MAESQRMTTDEVVAQLLSTDQVDLVRESLAWIVQQMMEAEVSELIGAEHGERTPDRATHRNGYRPRRWDTRAGEIELQIPKLRQGSGGFNWSSQHLSTEVGDGQAGWVDDRADGQGDDEVAGQAVVAARRRATVLA